MEDFLHLVFGDYRGFVLFVLNIAFIAGIYYTKIKSFVPKESVAKMIEEEIDKRLIDHCPYSEKITDIEDKTDKIDEDMQIVKEKVTTITINLKSICAHLKIPYHTGNGK